MDWNKIIIAAVSVVLMGLEGISIKNQAATDDQIVSSEGNLLKQMYELEKKMAQVGDNNGAKMDQLLKRVPEQKSSDGH